MALVEDTLLSIEGVGFVSITYDDALAVSDDVSNCDLISARVVVFAGAAADYSILRRQSVNVFSGTLVGPVDQIHDAFGPIRKVPDLTGFGFGGRTL